MMWDLIVSVPDHCLSFYSVAEETGVEPNLVANQENVPRE